MEPGNDEKASGVASEQGRAAPGKDAQVTDSPRALGAARGEEARWTHWTLTVGPEPLGRAYPSPSWIPARRRRGDAALGPDLGSDCAALPPILSQETWAFPRSPSNVHAPGQAAFRNGRRDATLGTVNRACSRVQRVPAPVQALEEWDPLQGEAVPQSGSPPALA